MAAVQVLLRLTLAIVLSIMTEMTTEARILVAEASASEDEDRSLNALATLSLNTLTTSCNGGCRTNSPCVVLGQSSDNAIDCVNDVRCATLLNGRTALCMEPFGASDATWAFAPAKSDNVSGVAPFERVGLVQLGDQVTEVDFKIAMPAMTPLTNLDISSLNVQPSTTLTKISFSDLILTGIDGALPLNGAKQIAINNCRLKTIPTQFIAGSQVTSLDLSNNGILTVPTDFQNQSFPTLAALDLSRNALTMFNLRPSNFPALTSLVLSNNQLQTFPSVIFNLTTLQLLSLDSNPLNASTLTEEQFTFLANLPFFSINGTTETDVCPSEDVIAKLNSTFTFCVNGNSSEDVISAMPTTEPPATDAPVIQTSQDSSLSKAWIWIVIAIVCVLLFGLLFLLYRRKRQREESPKLANSITPSIAVGMGDLADHPYMELNPPSSCSQTTSDFELLANVADGYIALTRLSYNDVFLHRMIRVSSRSELWFGEYMDESVIIKKIKSNAASKTVLREFVTEIEHMVELKHSRIATFKGAMWDNEGTELCAVVEYVENGALRDCIASSVGLSVSKQHAIARQITDALVFLHQKRIVHGRLNSFNVLLDRDYSAKLSVFSIFHYVKLSPLDAECGIFAAPEVLRGGQPTEKSDVYSLGVILVELDTGENPVVNAKRTAAAASASASRKDNESIVSRTSRQIGFRLSVHCSPVLKEIIAACLEKEPARRPKMSEIAFALQTGRSLQR